MRLVLAVIVIAAAIAACDSEAMFQKFIPQEEAAEGQKVIAQVAARDFEAIESRLDVSLRTLDAREKFNQLADYLPKGRPKSISTIGVHTFKGESDTRYDLTYEYEYEKTWMLASVVLHRKAGQLLIEGLHVNLTPQSQKALNAFKFSEKGPLHYAVLILAVVIPLFIVATLVVCYRTTIAKRKWLWYLFVALGLVQFSFNWTTGAWNIQPISFMLFGAGFAQVSQYAPLIFTIGLPVGAVVFLARRKSLVMRSEA
jgi:hypothetical protein